MKQRELIVSGVVVVCILLAVQVSSASPYFSGEPGSAPGFDRKIKEIIDNITETKVLEPLEDLVAFRTRYAYSPVIRDAANYIQARFNHSGLETEQQCFLFGGQSICNVIGIKRGMLPSKDPIIVSGHYDSIVLDGNDPFVYAPGADDDGSGTAATIAIADVMKEYRFNETIKFIGWVAEEEGLIGSTYYVKNLDPAEEGVKAIFQMDMIGNIATPGVYGMDFGTNKPSNWIGDIAMDVKTTYGIDINLYLDKDSNAGSSDHAPFWEAGYQGAYIAEHDFSPNWHKVSDTIANLSVTNVARVAKVVAGCVATIAGVVHEGQGSLYFDRRGYPPRGNATLVLNDTDLKGAKSYVLTVRSSLDEEDIQLQPVSGKDGEFSAEIPLEKASSGNKGDGRLQVKVKDVINSTYLDDNYKQSRNASAVIDGIPPVISNVTARDITNESAAIYFDTDELTTAVIEYGKNASLGSTIFIPELKKMQYTVIWGLQNDTDYFFKVRGIDRFGNIAEDDNSGYLYRFKTATLSIKPEMPGYAGWVVSSESSGNHFNDDDMYTGYDEGDTYISAVQFKTDMIKDPENITGVSLSLATQTTAYMGKGGKWVFQMLSPAIDSNFPTKTFSQISGATAESNLGVFTADEIAPAWWNTAIFSPTDLQKFLTHIPNKRVTFRTNTLESGGLADWDTGYIKDATQRGLGPKWAPRLNIFVNSSYATIEGRVSSGGNPLPGAGVAVLENASGKKVAEITTQALGRYYLRVPPGVYDMFAFKKGYYNSSVKVVMVNASEHLTGVDFELEKEITAGNLEVTVLSEGTPVKGAEVSIRIGDKQVANGTTNDSGRVNATVEQGVYNVSAHKIGYFSANKTARVIRQNTTSITIVLAPAQGWISGVVRDNTTKEPVAGITIKGLIGGQVEVSTETNATGVYNLSVLVPRKEYTVNVSGTGYYPQERVVAVNSTWDIWLIRKVPVQPKNGTLLAKVVDEQGNPLAGAKVNVSNASGIVASGETSDLGVFTFTLSPGVYTVSATKSGYLENTTTVTIYDEKQTNITITIKRMEENKPSEESPVIAIVIGAVVVVAILLISILLMRRRRSPTPSTREEDRETKEDDKNAETEENEGPGEGNNGAEDEETKREKE